MNLRESISSKEKKYTVFATLAHRTPMRPATSMYHLQPIIPSRHKPPHIVISIFSTPTRSQSASAFPYIPSRGIQTRDLVYHLCLIVILLSCNRLPFRPGQGQGPVDWNRHRVWVWNRIRGRDRNWLWIWYRIWRRNWDWLRVWYWIRGRDGNWLRFWYWIWGRDGYWDRDRLWLGLWGRHWHRDRDRDWWWRRSWYHDYCCWSWCWWC